MRKKQALAGLMRAAGVMRAAAARRRRTPGELVVLAYHRVLPLPRGCGYPFDIELVSAEPEGFDWQMAWLSRNFNVLPVSGIAESLERGDPLPPGAVAVTFDDGFLDNYTHAFPVLQRHRIPACIFLSTGYVGSAEPFWFEVVARLLMGAPVRSVDVGFSGERLPAAGDEATRRNDVKRVLSRLKRMPDDARRASIEMLKSQLSGLHESPDGCEARAMDWSHVAEMARAGIEFGSHGVSHAVLSRLEPAALAAELADSRRAIEQATGAAAVAIAYPVGGEDAIGEAVPAAAAGAGFRLGFTYLQGANRLARADRMRLSRQHVERYTSPAYFQGLVAFPSLFD